MSYLLIPTPSADGAISEQRTALDGVQYVLQFRWNDRDSAWYLTIANQDGTVQRSGIKMVPNFALLYYVPPLDTLPPGELYLFGPPGLAPTLDNLSTDFKFYYIESE